MPLHPPKERSTDADAILPRLSLSLFVSIDFMLRWKERVSFHRHTADLADDNLFKDWFSPFSSLLAYVKVRPREKHSFHRWHLLFDSNLETPCLVHIAGAGS